MLDDGRTIPEWAGRRRAEALKRVKAIGRANRTPCCICGLPINYDLEYPHPSSCSVQHIKPRSAYPHLTWEPSNWAPACLSCNKSLGSSAPPDLGVTSTEW